jgi:phosphoglycerate dehydrogenase-like enzyme
MINGFTLHDTSTAPPASAEILDGVKKAWGFVPHLHRVLAESPAALEAYNTLWGIAENTNFTPQERNIVYLAIIYENECTLANMRGIDREAASLKAGGWQTGLGSNLRPKNLGVVGLGNLGREVARIGLAFGMKVIAWSQNLMEEKASAAGATLVDKQTLFREADVVTVHLVLSGRTRGLIGRSDFALMKPTARFVNTSRGPIVDVAAPIEALQARRIAGAAVDVFNAGPLQADHPFRKLENILATPHIGYVTEDLYRTFYGDAAANIARGSRST